MNWECGRHPYVVVVVGCAAAFVVASRCSCYFLSMIERKSAVGLGALLGCLTFEAGMNTPRLCSQFPVNEGKASRSPDSKIT